MFRARRANRLLPAVACAVLSAAPVERTKSRAHYPLGTADPTPQLRRTPISRNLPLDRCSPRRAPIQAVDTTASTIVTPGDCTGSRKDERAGANESKRPYKIRSIHGQTIFCRGKSLPAVAGAGCDALNRQATRPFDCRSGQALPPQQFPFPQREHDVRGRRRVDGQPERVSDQEIANQKRREDFSSRRSSLWGQSYLGRYFVPAENWM
jgi:hypothetical protein